MDPLDPLTEIINSGQAFSSVIAIERFVWLLIGIFFIGAVFNSVTNSSQKQDSGSRKSFLNNIRPNKHKSEES